MNNSDKTFAGSIPKFYETYLVPLIFEQYAEDLAARLGSHDLSNVLEIAAGTGVVTRALAKTLPETCSIVATDLNQAMIDQAAEIGTARSVEWRQADALDLPFEDETFDAVACQFGAMFFPYKAKAFAEVRRVLRAGGVFVFNVWDRLAENEFPNYVNGALEAFFPDDPPRFLARTPYGYYDFAVIEQDLRDGEFEKAPLIETIAHRSRASSPRIPALAFCQGTPLKTEIEARDASRLEEATDAAAKAIAERFGQNHVEAKIQAHVVTVEK